jgi:hypothetical protein
MKSIQMWENGYSGALGVVGGSALCDGCDSMHEMHESLFLWMSVCRPGQYNVVCARKIIAVVPWCAACSCDRTFFLRLAGTTTLLSKKSMSLWTLKWARAFQ